MNEAETKPAADLCLSTNGTGYLAAHRLVVSHVLLFC